MAAGVVGAAVAAAGTDTAANSRPAARAVNGDRRLIGAPRLGPDLQRERPMRREETDLAGSPGWGASHRHLATRVRRASGAAPGDTPTRRFRQVSTSGSPALDTYH